MNSTNSTRPDHLSCREVRRILQSFLDGELTPADAERVEEHLQACRRCGLDAETYRHVKQVVSGLRRDVDPEALERLETFVEDLAPPS